MIPPLWVDCDNALGAAFRDVDDGLVLAWLVRQARGAVRGVSLVHGNAPLRVVRSRTAALLHHAGARDLPSWCGAARRGGGESAATRALAAAVLAEPGRIVVLALGPLTNLAAAERAQPGLLGRCASVIALGGTLGDRRLGWRPVRELNFAADPAAARLVLERAPRLTVIPATSCLDLTLGWADIGRLPSWLRRPVALWLAALIAGRLSTRMVVWDMLAVLAVTHAGLLASRPTTLECGTDGRLREGPGGRHRLVEGITDPAAAREAMLAGL